MSAIAAVANPRGMSCGIAIDDVFNMSASADTCHALDNDSAKLFDEFDKNCEESRRYWESLGYTEETFMEMVNEEIRAYHREKALAKAGNGK